MQFAFWKRLFPQCQRSGIPPFLQNPITISLEKRAIPDSDTQQAETLYFLNTSCRSVCTEISRIWSEFDIWSIKFDPSNIFDRSNLIDQIYLMDQIWSIKYQILIKFCWFQCTQTCRKYWENKGFPLVGYRCLELHVFPMKLWWDSVETVEFHSVDIGEINVFRTRTAWCRKRL